MQYAHLRWAIPLRRVAKRSGLSRQVIYHGS